MHKLSQLRRIFTFFDLTPVEGRSFRIDNCIEPTFDGFDSLAQRLILDGPLLANLLHEFDCGLCFVYQFLLARNYLSECVQLLRQLHVLTFKQDNSPFIRADLASLVISLSLQKLLQQTLLLVCFFVLVPSFRVLLQFLVCPVELDCFLSHFLLQAFD